MIFSFPHVQVWAGAEQRVTCESGGLMAFVTLFFSGQLGFTINIKIIRSFCSVLRRFTKLEAFLCYYNRLIYLKLINPHILGFYLYALTSVIETKLVSPDS